MRETGLRPEKRKLVKLIKAEKITRLRAEGPTNPNGQSIYGCPLWLAAFGTKR